MEEEDRNSKLEADIEELRQQLKLAQRESYNRKADLKRDRAFLGDELQRVRQKAVVTEQEKEAYESKLKALRIEIKELQEAAKHRSPDQRLPLVGGDTEVDEDVAHKDAELAALRSQLDAARRVWVVQNEQWSSGTLVDRISNDSAAVMTQDGNVTEQAIADLLPADLQLNENCTANMAALGAEGLKDPVLVETLLDNANKQALFTFVGSVLLYLHDSKVLEKSLRGPDVRAAYRCCNHTSELPPHVFAVLETAKKSMGLEQQSQSVILTGAAGAGKSTLFRASLEYLVLDQHKHVHKLLHGLTVLEAFGTAQTVTNKFSSRVSTLVEIQYDIAGTALGASVAVYGLEKMRITTQKDFNFSVFYQMCAGATEGEKKTLHLMSAAEFPYLNSHSNAEENRRISNSAGVNYDSSGDVERYRHLKTAMSNMGLDSVMRAAIFRILAAILWLGKIEFYQDKDGIKDRTVLDKAAHLLRCTASDLEQALRCNTPKEATHFDGLSEIQAQNRSAVCARDMLAQALYIRVFNWIIERINGLLSRDDAFSVIGVLDLVSFEMLQEDNTFDQFYRNYATECVENLFNRDFFEVEQDEYEAENLQLPESFEFPSSRGCIDLIDRQGGFISLLDQECQFAKGSEAALIRRLNSTFERDPFFSRGRSKRGFNISHWQSEVHYITTDMIEKNQDILPPSVVSLMDQCKCRFLAELFPSADIPQSSRPVTLLTQLRIKWQPCCVH
jgi:myosin heavy subunit